MEKVKLQLETLTVESFETSALVREPRGTVHGNATTKCSPEDTCGYSCLDPGSCAGTCACTGGLTC